jgi:hypothetical protein
MAVSGSLAEWRLNNLSYSIANYYFFFKHKQNQLQAGGRMWRMGG